MASADVRRELLDCSVCLNIYTDPVTLRCGHNFCRVCIDCVLDTQRGCGVYSCPECRAESVERPVLVRNITLCNIVESFHLTQPAQEETGIFCTYCVDSSVPAVKSCLLCEASLCDKHLRVHSKAPEHVLMDPTTSLENTKCSIHKKILEYFCVKDSVCICVSCRLDGAHQGHTVETLDEASEKKKMNLSNVLQELITKREKIENKVQNLQKRKGEIPKIAADVKEMVSALVMNIIVQLEDLKRKVLGEISWQEGQISRSLSDLIKQLEIKKDKLSSKIHRVEELCNIPDPFTVLQDSDVEDLSDSKMVDDQERGTLNKQLHRGGEFDVTVISKTLHTLSDVISKVKRGTYIQKPEDLLLDVNTAGNELHISEDLKTASYSKKQNYPEKSERFMHPQVISRTSFSSGRLSWEVEIKESVDFIVGMCYASTEKKGVMSYIGYNGKSWGLDRKNTGYFAVHGSNETRIRSNIGSNRFRITMDYEGGKLSFYELCEPIKHLHTFTTTFTEPLHAALEVWQGSVEITGFEVEQSLFSI